VIRISKSITIEILDRGFTVIVRKGLLSSEAHAFESKAAVIDFLEHELV
jgi:hypothetical protein